MTALQPPEYVTRADGLRLAFRHVRGKGPTLVFFPGYMSDMQGSKAAALEAWAIRDGRPFLRFDYCGCGESEGVFEEQTLETWLADAVRIIALVLRGPLVLIGSSMGGWLATHAALALGSDVKGLIGIAAAPDFADWGFTDTEKGKLQKYGRIERPSDYGPEPTVTTGALWESGRRLRLLDKPIALSCPIRLLHGQDDADVPWDIALRFAAQLCSGDVQTILVKDGDHRLSREQDIALILRTTKEMLDGL